MQTSGVLRGALGRWGASPARATGLPRRRQVLGLVLCLVGLPLLTWVTVTSGLPGRRESVLLFYLSAVVVIAVAGGLLPGFVAALGGFLAANWFHTPPYATLAVGQPEAVVDLVVFVLVAGVVSVVVEIGARDRARAERNRLESVRSAARAEQLAETDRVRSALLTAVSHDLRTPIAGIKAAVSGLRQGDVDWEPEEESELLANIEQSADGLARLVDNLLAMSRIQAGAVSVRLGVVSVDEVVSRALLGWAGVPVHLSIPEDLPPVLADSGLLERVIANLLANARRFTPPDMSVEVGAVVATFPAGSPSVQVRVIDHGPGAGPEHWDDMFAPFQRLGDTTPGGVGLGLAIARGLTAAMGGTVTPEHTPGGGLTMCVELPARS